MSRKTIMKNPQSSFVELSIIIVNFNSKAYLKNCLQSIINNNPQVPYEILVVDNASTDGSRKLIEQEFPDINLITNEKNEGFARASNKGAKVAKGEYLLFLNPDTIVMPGTLNQALDFIKNTGDAGVVGAKTLNQKGKIQPTAFGFPGLIRMMALILGLNRYFKISRLKNYSRVINPYYVQGSFFLIRQDLFQKAGGFDEKFFLFFEDADLCQRVRERGFKIYYLPGATIQHFGGSSQRFEGVKLERFVHSLLLFYEKHSSLKGQKRLKVALNLTFRLLLLVTLKKDNSKVYRRLLQKINN